MEKRFQAFVSSTFRDLVEERTALRITAHQFRHAGAAMLLQKHPNNWPMVAKLLGHRTWTTTVKNYAEIDILKAHRLFLDLIAEQRTLGKAA